MEPSLFRNIFRGDGLPAQLEYLKGKLRGNSSAIAWGDGKTLVVQFTASVASASVVDDVQICGPLYARAGGYLVAKDTSAKEAKCSASWNINDVVVARISTDPWAIKVGTIDVIGPPSPFGTKSSDISLLNADISDFDKAPNVSSGSSGLWLSANSGLAAHTNSALHNSGNDTDSFRSFEVTIGSVVTNNRIAVGSDKNNFFFINLTDGCIYSVVNGSFVGTIVGSFYPTTTSSGSKIRFSVFGSNSTPVVQLFHNDIPVTIINNALSRNDSTPLLPSSPMKFGVAWRSFAETWYATNIKFDEISIPRYMHLSFDDVLGDLIAAESLSSIWSEPFFAKLKTLHEKYGAVFSLYCFVSDGGHLITELTAKHKSELQQASEWLKFGFHAYSSSTTYDSGVSSAAARSHYDTVMSAIKVFAGEESIDYMPRIHYFAGTLAQCLEWKAAGAEGFLSADDTRTSYYHYSAQNKAITTCESLVDYINNINFARTAFRLENTSDVNGSISALINQTGSVKGQTKELIVFSHAYLLDGSNGIEEKMEQCCVFANNYGIRFSFPFIERRKGVRGSGTMPALTDTTTIGTIDQVQVWSGHPASSIIVKVLQGL